MREPGRHKVWASETITWDSYLHNWPRNSHHQNTGQTIMKYIWQVRLLLGAVPQISLYHLAAQRSQTLSPSTGMVTCFVGIKLVGTTATLYLNPNMILEMLRQVDFLWCFCSLLWWAAMPHATHAYKTPWSWVRCAQKHIPQTLHSV